jgi:quercetin dioxygenase-like cupin family protein
MHSSGDVNTLALWVFRRMQRKLYDYAMRPILAAALLAASLASFAQQGPPKPPPAIAFLPESMVWKEAPPPLPAGSKTVVLEGDPRGEGLFTMRVRIPAGSAIPPHWHPRQERVTILSGAALLGFGSVANAGLATRYGAGSFYVNPPRVMHYLFFPEATEFQVTAAGPWEMETSDITPQQGAASTATVVVRNITPGPGSELTPSTIIKTTVEYEIRNFHPATYYLSIVFDSTIPNRTFGVGPEVKSTGDRPVAPPRPSFLNTATGTATLTQEVSRVFAHPELKHPIRLRVFVHEQITESSSRVAGASDWIQYQ